MKRLRSLPVACLLFFSFPMGQCLAQQAFPFAVKVSGTGKQPILFIPGFACSGDVWNDTRVLFEKDYTCYTLTMAGFAGIAPQPGASFAAWEKAIALFISDKKLNKPVIIGHSMGGGLALAIAADYPALVSKIVVVDALPCLPAMMNPSYRSKPDNDCSAVISNLKALTDAQFYQMQKQSITRMVADTSRQEQVIQWTVQSDRETFGSMYCDFMNTDLREKIASVQCPALILLETYFGYNKPAISQQYQKLPAANIQYATKGLHFIMYDDTDWYQAQLQHFLFN